MTYKKLFLLLFIGVTLLLVQYDAFRSHYSITFSSALEVTKKSKRKKHDIKYYTAPGCQSAGFEKGEVNCVDCERLLRHTGSAPLYRECLLCCDEGNTTVVADEY